MRLLALGRQRWCARAGLATAKAHALQRTGKIHQHPDVTTRVLVVRKHRTRRKLLPLVVAHAGGGEGTVTGKPILAHHLKAAP